MSSENENTLNFENIFISDDVNIVDLTKNQDGGILKFIQLKGHGDLSPVLGDIVKIKYFIRLPNNLLSNNEKNHQEEFEFLVEDGKGSVIEAWQITIRTMKLGEVCYLKCSPPYNEVSRSSKLNWITDDCIYFKIELISWKGKDVSRKHDGSILKSIILEGEGYKTPRDMATCEVLLSRKEGNNISDEECINFIMGEGFSVNLNSSLEEAIRSLKLNEKSWITIKGSLSKGDSDNPDKDISKNKDLEYIVHLKNFILVKDSWEMDIIEKFETSSNLRNRALELFKIDRSVEASKYYQHLIDCWKDEIALKGEEMQKRNFILSIAYSNLAACHLKVNNFNDALTSADEALKYDVESTKALYRRGLANLNLKSYENSINDFEKLLKLDPDNKAAIQKVNEAKLKKRQFLEKEKALYSAMLRT